MYEQFGALVDQNARTVSFKLFLPDGDKAPTQYQGGGLPRISDVAVVGSFQPTAWDPASAPSLTPSDYRDPAGGLLKGTVYAFNSAPLPSGFYEYKYLVTFEDGSQRWITDPCARYGGASNQNSGFVVGGTIIKQVDPIANRLPLADLNIYELMIDDFTSEIQAADEAPLQTVTRLIPYLKDLGINAIELMPWTAWSYPDDPAHDFSWGYNPVQYFSVAHKYTLNPTTDTDKLVYLKQLVNACHASDIHVIMDGVFNHADATPPDHGFPYYWLYEDSADSPYVGNFAQAAYFKDLDYHNQCTLEYIRDATLYWIDTFKIDGIRFDNTLGFYRAGDRGHGLPKLLSELRGYLSSKKISYFGMTLEHEWDYSSIDVTNKVGATSCWLDPYRARSQDFLGNRQVEPSIMRMLDAGRDFDVNRAPTIYVENHDHRRLMRKTGPTQDLWYLTQPYFMALFCSPGATLIYNGQEFGMNDDMPESGDGRVVPRPVHWGFAQTEPGTSLRRLYQRMLAIRSAHPGLRTLNFYPTPWDESVTTLDADGYGIDRARNVVVFHRWDDNELFYCVLNFSAATQHVRFRVPRDGIWQELVENGSATAAGGWLSVDVSSNYGAVYFGAA